MVFDLSRLNMLGTFTCVSFLLLLNSIQVNSATDNSHEHYQHFQRNNSTTNGSSDESIKQNADRRQDGGFDFMNYFIGGNAQQQQQQQPQQHTELRQSQPQPLTVQQQHRIQQELLRQQQQRQQEQLQLLQQQQLQQLQQPGRNADVNYQDNVIQQQHPPAHAVSREGGYGGVAYGEYAKPKEIGISIGAGKPVIQVGNILTLLPKIINVLSAGGKVMFGVELGNNFYFGPVGVKPLPKAG